MSENHGFTAKNPGTGCQMGQKLTPLRTWVQHPISISNITEVHWWGSGGKRSSDGFMVRARVRFLCRNRPKSEAEHPPRSPGSSYSPQIFPAA